MESLEFSFMLEPVGLRNRQWEKNMGTWGNIMSAWRTIPRIVTSWYPWLSPGRHIDATHGHTIPSIHFACTFWISADCAEVENGWETLAVLQITSAALVPFKYGGTQTQHPWVVQKLLFEIFLAAHVFSHDAGLHLIISLLSPAVSRINNCWFPCVLALIMIGPRIQAARLYE